MNVFPDRRDGGNIQPKNMQPKKYTTRFAGGGSSLVVAVVTLEGQEGSGDCT